MHYYQVSDKSFREFKELCKKKNIEYENDAEYKAVAQNLLNFVGLLVDIDKEERELKSRLKKEPKGFAMEGEGRNCSLCRQIVGDEKGWYDKWGFKCMNCQDAINKKKVPGSLCRDYKHEKYRTDSTLAWETGLHTRTIQKLIRQGKIIAREIPKGPFLILKKDNPNLADVIDAEGSSK